jgi:hypothetical protein
MKFETLSKAIYFIKTYYKNNYLIEAIQKDKTDKEEFWLIPKMGNSIYEFNMPIRNKILKIKLMYFIIEQINIFDFVHDYIKEYVVKVVTYETEEYSNLVIPLEEIHQYVDSSVSI